jgi:hypothetical protein
MADHTGLIGFRRGPRPQCLGDSFRASFEYPRLVFLINSVRKASVVLARPPSLHEVREWVLCEFSWLCRSPRVAIVAPPRTEVQDPRFRGVVVAANAWNTLLTRNFHCCKVCLRFCALSPPISSLEAVLRCAKSPPLGRRLWRCLQRPMRSQ